MAAAQITASPLTRDFPNNGTLVGAIPEPHFRVAGDSFLCAKLSLLPLGIQSFLCQGYSITPARTKEICDPNTQAN